MHTIYTALRRTVALTAQHGVGANTALLANYLAIYTHTQLVVAATTKCRRGDYSMTTTAPAIAENKSSTAACSTREKNYRQL